MEQNVIAQKQGNQNSTKFDVMFYSLLATFTEFG
jgi:hypothetical protein